MTAEPPIVIAGAGVAGLTAALALIRRGIPVRVAEQAAELRAIGAGLQLGPNGTRLLFKLGLRDALLKVAVEPSGKEVRLWNTGESRPLFDLGAVSVSRYGFPYLTVHRADLQRVMVEAVEAACPGTLQTGKGLAGVSGLEEGGPLGVSFADGTQTEAAAVLGADGVHSALRGLLFGEDRPAYTGCMAWRGTARAAALPERLRRNVGVNWVGPGAHVIHYPLRTGELVNFVGIVERAEWTAESWTAHGSPAECAADFAGWHDDVHTLIASLEEPPSKWGLMGREPMTQWWKSRACLIGDACHPMLPFLAQGANMAVEDGYVLAACLEAGPDVAAAFARFQSLRLERANMAVTGSAENTKRFHNPALADPVLARRYLDEQWQPQGVERRYGWLFAYQGDTVLQ